MTKDIGKYASKCAANGGVAQLGEHLPCKQGVMGSNPIISTRSAVPTANIVKTRLTKKAREEIQSR